MLWGVAVLFATAPTGGQLVTHETWSLVVALFALIGPALVLAGWWIGRVAEKTTSAHVRIDRLERVLTDEFHEVRKALKESLDNAWRNCPLTRRDAHDEPSSRKG